MKLHKFTVYVLDFERYGAEECAVVIDRSIDIGRVVFSGTAEIGEWDDDHPFNTGKRDPESYFKETV